MKFARSTLSFLTVLGTVTTATADTVFVRDTLYVPLRGGQSTEHRILHRGLKSGTKLERLETNDETGYTRVKTETGMEGWLQSQYLVDEPIAGTRLETVNKKLGELEAEHQQTLLDLREQKDSNARLTEQAAVLSNDNAKLQQDLTEITELAADVIAIDDENQRLIDERESLEATIDELANRNDSLLDNQAQRWFLTGGGTILIGLLFGFWIARRIYQRRNTSGWA